MKINTASKSYIIIQLTLDISHSSPCVACHLLVIHWRFTCFNISSLLKSRAVFPEVLPWELLPLGPAESSVKDENTGVRLHIHCRWDSEPDVEVRVLKALRVVLMKLKTHWIRTHLSPSFCDTQGLHSVCIFVCIHIYAQVHRHVAVRGQPQILLLTFFLLWAGVHETVYVKTRG